MPLKRIPTIGSDNGNWGQILNDHLLQQSEPTTGGVIKWTTSTRPPSLTADDQGKTGINTDTGDTERWTGSSWEILTETNKVKFCDVVYGDDARMVDYLANSNPSNPAASNDPNASTSFSIYPQLVKYDHVINRKTNKIYRKKADGTWENFVPGEDFTVVNKSTGSIFRYKPGTSPNFEVSSAQNWVNVRDWGARGDAFGGINYGADDTQPIQAAINWAVQAANPAAFGIVSGYNTHSSVCYFPFGEYVVTDEILIPGVVNLKGEGGSSYSGSVINQGGKNKSLFKLSQDTDGSSNGSHFEDLFLRIGGTSNTSETSAITSKPNMSSNSIYIRNCFFQVTADFATTIDFPRGDDIQISGCTFDTGRRCLKLGSVANASYTFGTTVTNCTIQNCTFFGMVDSFMRLINVENLNIIGNRMYGGRSFNGNTGTPVGIDMVNVDLTNATDNIKNVNIIGNTISECGVGIQISTLARKVSIHSNIFTKISARAISLESGNTVDSISIQSNQISGNFSAVTGSISAGGAINGGGCGMINSIVKDNIIQGNENGTNSTIAINFPDSRTTGNNIKENIVYGFSGPNVIANPAQNVL
jgi:hypothetical protein